MSRAEQLQFARLHAHSYYECNMLSYWLPGRAINGQRWLEKVGGGEKQRRAQNRGNSAEILHFSLVIAATLFS